MGLFDTLRKFRLSLTSHDRQQIVKYFGSFRANQLAMSSESYLKSGYESNVDVYAAIKKIIDCAKNQPFIIEEKDADGQWQEITDSTLHELLEKPNKAKGYTFDDILEQLLIYLLANGNGLLYGTIPAGFRTIEELDVLPSPFVEVKSNDNFFMPELKYLFTLNGKMMKLEQEEIGHVRFFNPLYNSVDESFWGLSPIQVAARVVQSGNDRWDADANLLQNRGAIGLITDKSNAPMLPEEAAKIQSSFDKRTTGTHNFGKTVVTNKDLTYIQMAMTSQDLQLIEKGVVNLRAICNVFGLDSSLFNDPANKTFNNRKEAEKALYTNAVMPTMERIESMLNNWLVQNHFPDRNVRMRSDYSEVEVLQENQQMEAMKDKTVMEGVNLILQMPISNEGKAELLSSTYDYDEEMIAVLLSDTTNQNND